jgi:outer membrane lipoprotein LolB
LNIESLITVNLLSTIRFHLLLGSILLLCACAGTPPQVNLDSRQHQAELANFTHWQINGRMAFKSPQEKFSANLFWQQIDDTYQLKLSSMFGTSLLAMQGDRQSVELEADDQHYQDTDASHLIWRITGWAIPVSHFPRWIKGQIRPEDQARYSEQGWLSQLIPGCIACDGWQIDYTNYQLVDNIWLPHQVELTHQALNNQIVIRVNKWTKS